MADVNTHCERLLDMAPVLQDLETNVSRILAESEVKHRDSIVESLITDIDDQLLQESRDILFRSAVDLYDEILDSQGIEGSAYLSMKKRKTTANNAKDCHNLFAFCAGIISIFPRDILSSDSKYINTTQDECSQYKGDDKTANELNKVEVNVRSLRIC